MTADGKLMKPRAKLSNALWKQAYKNYNTIKTVVDALFFYLALMITIFVCITYLSQTTDLVNIQDNERQTNTDQ